MRRIALSVAVLMVLVVSMTTLMGVGRASATPLEDLINAMEVLRELEARIAELEEARTIAARAGDTAEFNRIGGLIIETGEEADQAGELVETLANSLEPMSTGETIAARGLGARCITVAGWCAVVGGGGYCIYQANEYRRNVNVLCDPGTDPAYCLTDGEINGIDILGHPHEFLNNVWNYWFGSDDEDEAPQQSDANTLRAESSGAVPATVETFAPPGDCLPLPPETSTAGSETGTAVP